jgi:hypothetical protein
MTAVRVRSRTLAALAMAALGLGGGCYATTPHRAQVASSTTPSHCASVVADVFARSGFVQVARTPQLSMLFTARTAGPYNSFLPTGTGVGVKLTGESEGSGWCRVELEAVSPDADCVDVHSPFTCAAQGAGTVAMDPVTGDTSSVPVPAPRDAYAPACPIVRPLLCQLSYAPGAENDAAVDELARRVRAALGENASVN